MEQIFWVNRTYIQNKCYHSRWKCPSNTFRFYCWEEIVFVVRPNNRTSMARDLFRWVRAEDSRLDTPGGSKYATGPISIPLKGRLRRQVMNLSPPDKSSASGRTKLPVKAHFDRLPLETGHTRPDPCRVQRGRLKCLPAPPRQ